MAERMDRLVALAGGEIVHKDVRSYGVVFVVRKKEAGCSGQAVPWQADE